MKYVVIVDRVGSGTGLEPVALGPFESASLAQSCALNEIRWLKTKPQATGLLAGLSMGDDGNLKEWKSGYGAERLPGRGVVQIIPIY